jgi:hypothetical protein
MSYFFKRKQIDKTLAKPTKKKEKSQMKEIINEKDYTIQIQRIIRDYY